MDPEKTLPIQSDAQKKPCHTVIEIGYRVAGFVVEKGVNKLKTKILNNYHFYLHTIGIY